MIATCLVGSGMCIGDRNTKHRQSGVYGCRKTASDYLSQYGDAAAKDHTLSCTVRRRLSLIHL